ncbi:MAG TPA: GNAT family N-acetyltransferase [Terriglobales bacterium]|nr:GNAT family N-acetyltransferase [Terriglobales bacterium]
MPHHLETSRLVLREFAESDIPELVPLISAPEVAATTLRIPHPYEEKHAREYLAMAPKENELRLGIRLRSDGRLIGGIGLHPQMEHQRAELGYGSACRTGATDMRPRLHAKSCATVLKS